MIAAAISGTALVFLGATTPNLWLLRAHIATSVAGTCLLLASVVWPAARARSAQVQAAAAIAVMFIVLASAIAAVTAYRHDETRRQAHRIVNPDVVPAAMEEEGAGPASPFFPSSANTTVNGTIPANFFLTSESCARCHREIYDQWNSSAHHFSSFNNQWYRKSIEYMQDVVGTRPSKWCAGCHDHAVFFNGRFDKPIREQIDTPEAQAGLGCTSCHAITRVNSTMGQGDFVVEYPPLHDLAASDNPILQSLHDWLLYLDPKPHRETFLKPFHREQTPEFCASCHKVHLDVPVNAYRWFRGFNDYDNWQASGVSGEGARSFYYPPKPQRCADCHMPLVQANDPAAKNGMVRSHRFAAANTALPFVNGDRAQLDAVQTFLRDGQISVDVFGIVRGDTPAAARRGCGGHGRATALEHVRSRRRIDQLRRRLAGRTSGGRGDRAARQGQRLGAARRVGARRSGRAHAQGRALLPGRHGRRLRCVGGIRGDRRSRAHAAPQRRAPPTAAADRSMKARISIAACCSTVTAIRSTSGMRGPRDRWPTCG